jgi:hypothetical protein
METKVDSIGARLGCESEFDAIISCTSVESSGESKVGLLDSENRTTLDRHDVCTDELAKAVAYARGWSSLKYARRRWEHLEKTNPRYKSSPSTSTDRVRRS